MAERQKTASKLTNAQVTDMTKRFLMVRRLYLCICRFVFYRRTSMTDRRRQRALSANPAPEKAGSPLETEARAACRVE